VNCLVLSVYCHYRLVCETSAVGHGSQQTQHRQAGSQGQARPYSVRVLKAHAGFSVIPFGARRRAAAERCCQN